MSVPLHGRMVRDPTLLDTLKIRSRLLSAIRAFFEQRDFVEVTTPSLVLSPDPAVHLESFQTELVQEDGGRVPLYLSTSPEHHMKRLLAAGMKKIYQLAPFFRNGEMMPEHNPEFTGLEWYQVGATFEQLMDFTEELVRNVAVKVFARTSFVRLGFPIDLAPRFQRFSVREALRRFAGVEAPADWEEKALRIALTKAGIVLGEGDGFDDCVNRALLERVEPALKKTGPTCLYGFPAPMAALAKLRTGCSEEAERFELYAGGLELCNGYGELTDVLEQRRRFERQIQERRRLGRFVPPMDEAFLGALGHGMPAASGCALGVDRLLMLFCEKETIDQVMAFPMSLEISSPE
jgi:elongation factor P--(R)-beta-lysine ligase